MAMRHMPSVEHLGNLSSLELSQAGCGSPLHSSNIPVVGRPVHGQRSIRGLEEAHARAQSLYCQTIRPAYPCPWKLSLIGLDKCTLQVQHSLSQACLDCNCRYLLSLP